MSFVSWYNYRDSLKHVHFKEQVGTVCWLFTLPFIIHILKTKVIEMSTLSLIYSPLKVFKVFFCKCSCCLFRCVFWSNVWNELSQQGLTLLKVSAMTQRLTYLVVLVIHVFFSFSKHKQTRWTLPYDLKKTRSLLTIIYFWCNTM